jgi:hypothetical protein
VGGGPTRVTAHRPRPEGRGADGRGPGGDGGRAAAKGGPCRPGSPISGGTVWIRSWCVGATGSDVTRCLARRLTRRGHEANSAGDRPWLGCTCTGPRPHRRRVREQVLRAFTQEVRRRTARTRGVGLGQVLRDLRRDRAGGQGLWAWLRPSRGARRGTPGSGVGGAALRGSRGGAVGTATCVAGGSAGSWPGIWSGPPMGRGVYAVARPWPSPGLSATATAWVCHASRGAPSADGRHHTAGDVTHLSGGVGGERS